MSWNFLRGRACSSAYSNPDRTLCSYKGLSSRAGSRARNLESKCRRIGSVTTFESMASCSVVRFLLLIKTTSSSSAFSLLEVLICELVLTLDADRDRGVPGSHFTRTVLELLILEQPDDDRDKGVSGSRTTPAALTGVVTPVNFWYSGVCGGLSDCFERLPEISLQASSSRIFLNAGESAAKFPAGTVEASRVIKACDKACMKGFTESILRLFLSANICVQDDQQTNKKNNGNKLAVERKKTEKNRRNSKKKKPRSTI